MTTTALAGTTMPGMARVRLASARSADELLTLALRSRHDAVLGALGDAAGLRREPLAVLGDLLAGGALPDRALVVKETLPFTLGLANAWAGMARSTQEQEGAVEVFRQVLERVGPGGLGSRDQRNYLQVAFLVGRHDLVREGLGVLPRLTDAVAAGLRADLANPVVDGPGALPFQEWVALFGERFVAKDLTSPQVDAAAPTLFDGLHLEAAREVDGPLVTVVVPAFRPEAAGLLCSVRSMLAQSHANLEILVVDDCSGEDFDETFAQVEALDGRVRLIRQPRNGGSYLARNTALATARGELVTTQDADDWSHPERIARQVELMAQRPEAAGSRSGAIRCRPDLTRQWFGYSPERMNASALMVRREVLERIGGFDPIRKGADSEMHERLALLGGVVDVIAPLAVTRLAAVSLSRADFSVGRHSPDRVLFRSSFRHWHAQLAEEGAQGRVDERVTRAGQRPYPVPRSFVRGLPHSEVPSTAYPIVVLADQAEPLPPEVPEEIGALVTGGAGRVAVLGREDLGRGGAEVADWSGSLLDAATAGRLDLLTDDDEAHAQTLLVLEPGLLALPALPLPRLTADRVVVAAVPAADLESAGETVRSTWGVAPTWVARSRADQELWAAEGWDLPLVTDLVVAGGPA